MKRFILIVSAILTISANGYAASPEEEARFLAAVKTAFEKKDTQGFLNLYCWDGVPDFIRSVSEKTAPSMLESRVDTITLVAVSLGTAKEFVRDGVTYCNNLAVTKQIEIAHTYPKGKGKITIPVGEKNGKLYITTAAPKK